MFNPVERRTFTPVASILQPLTGSQYLALSISCAYAEENDLNGIIILFNSGDVRFRRLYHTSYLPHIALYIYNKG